MNSQQFTALALRTESRPESLAIPPDLLASTVMLMVYAGNVIDAVKRGIYYGKPLDTQKLADALGSLHGMTKFVAIFGGCTNLSNEAIEALRADVPCPLVPEKVNLRLLHATLGIFGEAGEMGEALLSSWTKNGTLDEVNFGEELGDVDWYKAIAHDELGIREEVTRSAVIAKLAARFPDKFTAEAANDRDLGNERLVLESNIPSIVRSKLEDRQLIVINDRDEPAAA